MKAIVTINFDIDLLRYGGNTGIDLDGKTLCIIEGQDPERIKERIKYAFNKEGFTVHNIELREGENVW